MSHVKGEHILPADYPVYSGYIYLVDGVPTKSDNTCLCQDFKRDHSAKEIRNCNLAERDLF